MSESALLFRAREIGVRHAPQEACRDLDTHSLVQRGKKRLGSLLTLGHVNVEQSLDSIGSLMMRKRSTGPLEMASDGLYPIRK